jgi:sec-independent protein translocase protein TatB
MFDIGFSEIVVIAVVALIVLGPERLPKAARTMGHLFGRLQRYVNDVKSDINREMELEELKKLQQEVKSAARDIEQSVSSAASSVESGVRDVEAQLNAGAHETATPPSTPPLAEPPAEPAPDAAPARQPTLPGFDRI